MARESLTSGTYSPRNEVKVTVWPAPDKDGDGTEVLEAQYSGDGELLGHELVRDDSGNPVHHYSAPEGFIHVPTREPGSNGETGTYVRSTDRGGVHRNRAGHAVEIRPGSALLEYPDGTSKLLTGEYEQLLFFRAHDKTGGEE